MAIEIEHKFLVINNDWQQLVTHSSQYKQGYLHSGEQSSIRVRLTNEKAWINIKSATLGIQRQEYEYLIPREEGLEILNTLCKKPIIVKTRYFVTNKQHVWEVDVFEGDNKGLIVAEIELSKIDEPFSKPTWIGKNVTEDLRYYNNNLCQNPFKNWK